MKDFVLPFKARYTTHLMEVLGQFFLFFHYTLKKRMQRVLEGIQAFACILYSKITMFDGMEISPEA